MSSLRLQVVIPASLNRRIRKAAQRSRQSTGAWVRDAIERHLNEGRPAADALDQLQRLGAPTADIAQMLNEIDAGRG